MYRLLLVASGRNSQLLHNLIFLFYSSIFFSVGSSAKEMSSGINIV